MGRKKMFASSARAEQELGFRIVPVYPAMRAAIEWSAPTATRHRIGGSRGLQAPE